MGYRGGGRHCQMGKRNLLEGKLKLKCSSGVEYEPLQKAIETLESNLWFLRFGCRRIVRQGWAESGKDEQTTHTRHNIPESVHTINTQTNGAATSSDPH